LGGDALVDADVQGHSGVVIEPGDDLGVDAGGEAVVGEVGLPALVGRSASKWCRADLGFFFGCGVTRAWRVRIRAVVAREILMLPRAR
jgi:hypothetical protein